MNNRWIQVDHTIVRLYHLSENDECFYAREYISGGGYEAGDANQLILNFKKPADRQGRPEWKYKSRAVSQFAAELAELLPVGSFVTFIPPSKAVDDEDYDNRFEQTAEALLRIRPDIEYRQLFTPKNTTGPAHRGGTRNPDALYRNLNWHGENCHHLVIFVIDDVVGSGGHFAACKRMILEHIPGCRVIGVFWARARDDNA